MDKLKAFWQWFKSLPILKPLLWLIWTRKGSIASAFTTLVIGLVPQLVPVEFQVLALLTGVLAAAILWVAVVIGIVSEDNAQRELTKELARLGFLSEDGKPPDW